MSKYSKNLVNGSIIIYISLILSAIAAYGLKYIMSRNFTVSEVGLFFGAISFVNFFAFLRDLGLSDTFVYFIPRYLIDKDKQKIMILLKLTMLVQLIAGLIFLLLIIFLSSMLTDKYFGDEKAYLLLIGLALSFIFEGQVEVLFRAFQGFQKILLHRATNVTFVLLTFLITGAFILLDISLRYFGFTYLLSSLLTFVIFFILFQNIFPFFEVKSILKKDYIKKTIDFSLPTMMGNLAMQLFGQQTIILLTLFSSLESVGLYVMARAIGKVVVYFYTALAQTFAPMISELWKKKLHKKINWYFNELVTMSLLLGLPTSISLYLYADNFLKLLFGMDYAVAYILLKLLSIYFLFFSFSSIFNVFFMNIGEPKIARNITYVLISSNLALNVVLIPLMDFVGAGIADLVSILVTIAYIYHIKRPYSFLTMPYKNILKLLVSTSFFIITALLIKNWVLSLLVASLVYGISVLALKIIDINKLKFIFSTISKR